MVSRAVPVFVMSELRGWEERPTSCPPKSSVVAESPKFGEMPWPDSGTTTLGLLGSSDVTVSVAEAEETAAGLNVSDKAWEALGWIAKGAVAPLTAKWASS